MHYGKNFETGELVVVGQDMVEIHLQNMPHHVKVHFKKRAVASPCDPAVQQSNDSLEWEVHKRSHYFNSTSKYRLLIKWNVSNARQIIWHADY